MRIVVHEPTVEAPEEAARVAAVVLAAVVTELGELDADGSPAASTTDTPTPTPGTGPGISGVTTE
jgi:hypothetical protein